MSRVLHLPLTGVTVETSAWGRGAEQAVAAALGLAPVPTPIPLPPPLPSRRAQNVIARHWRGELSLARSYWINHVVFGILVGLVLAALGAAIDRGGAEQPARWLVSLSLTWTVVVLYSIWGSVGVWRAATAYRRHSGKRLSAAAAKAMIVLGALSLIYNAVFLAIPKGYGICQILAGDTRVGPHQFKVLDNGTMLDFSGGISFGTAREFETMLKAMDNVRTVQLNSNGGRVAEAQKISDLIRARGLSTFVTAQCVSACTIVFLGGRQRYLLSTARLGFHQPYAPGMTGYEQRAAIAAEEARLQHFGLSRAFAERANAASPSGMWFPGLDELLREHVATNIVTPQPVVAGSAPIPRG